MLLVSICVRLVPISYADSISVISYADNTDSSAFQSVVRDGSTGSLDFSLQEKLLTDEPPTKIQPTNFGECIKCQERTTEELSKPRLESYIKFKKTIQQRASFGNPTFCTIYRRLRNYTPEILAEKNARWHRSCYATTVSQHHIRQDEMQNEKENQPNSVCSRTYYTRNSIRDYLEHLCFYCQDEHNGDPVHQAREMTTHEAIVSSSDNEEWKFHFSTLKAAGDASTTGFSFLYHSSCKLKAYKKYVYNKERKHDTLSHSCDISMSGDDTDEVTVTMGEDEAANICENMGSILRTAEFLRKAVINRKMDMKWKFNGSIDVDDMYRMIPPELLTFLNRLIQGNIKKPETDPRVDEMQGICNFLGITIVREIKTNRQVRHESKEASFRHKLETPFSVGLSLWLYHNLRSQKISAFMSLTCSAMSYRQVHLVCSRIANAVYQNSQRFGVFIPCGLKKGVPIRGSCDNIEKNISSLDNQYFDAMARSVYQSLYYTDARPIVRPLDLFEITSGFSTKIPDTCVPLMKCTISGSPKPQISPHYPNYVVGKYDDEFTAAYESEYLYLFGRFFSRERNVVETNEAVEPDDDTIGIVNIQGHTDAEKEADQIESIDAQNVPVWSGFNSLVTNDNNAQDATYSLPIINAKPDNWSTIATSIDDMSKLNNAVTDGLLRMLVTFDMDLYTPALKLLYLEDSLSDTKIELIPGAFHTTICGLRCLGRKIRGSGIDDAWVSCGLYTSVGVEQILKCSNYARALDAHEITLQAIFDLWLEEFFEKNGDIKSALELSASWLSKACKAGTGICDAFSQMSGVFDDLKLKERIKLFDEANSESAMYKWLRQYMDQAMTLLQHQRAIRTGNGTLYLASLEKLCPYFFQYDRMAYAQMIPEFVARIDGYKQSDPEFWSRFIKGDFTVGRSNNSFTRIGLDHAQEHEIKKLKGHSSITGITQSSSTLLKFCLCAPELARIAEEFEQMVNCDFDDNQKHHRLNDNETRKQETKIGKLYSVLKQQNIFKDMGKNLVKIMSGEIIEERLSKNILDGKSQGAAAYASFVEKRICGSTNLWDTMKKVQCTTFDTSAKELVVKTTSTETKNLRATAGLMARFLIIAKSSREIDLKESVSKYEFCLTNRNLQQADGNVLPTTDKSSIVPLLENLPKSTGSGSCSISHQRMCLIVDGMALVQEIMAVGGHSTCQEFASAFVHAIMRRSKDYALCIVVFDDYSMAHNSLKSMTRSRRTSKNQKIVPYSVGDRTPIGDKRYFLDHTTTKHNMTKYLLSKMYAVGDGKLVAVNGEEVLSFDGTYGSSVSSHEEADALIIYHAYNAVKLGYRVNITSPDTDVLLLAIRRAPLLGCCPSVLFGVGGKKRFIYVRHIHDALGSQKANALPKWHSLTGCDTTGKVKGKSKVTCLKAFLTSPDAVIAGINNLGCGDQPSQTTTDMCIKFLCSLYDNKVYLNEVDNVSAIASDMRYRKFKNLPHGSGVDDLPPTYDAWVEHVKRAHCQASVWEQDLCLQPTMPNKFDLGWKNYNGSLLPILTGRPPAPEDVIQLVSCSCGAYATSDRKVCSGNRCSCRRNGLECTEACRCEAEFERCSNTEPIVINTDGD